MITNYTLILTPQPWKNQDAVDSGGRKETDELQVDLTFNQLLELSTIHISGKSTALHKSPDAEII